MLQFRSVRWLSLVFLVATTLMLLAPASDAAPITFLVNLSGANEIPPTVSPAIGNAVITLDPVAQTIQLNITFSGLSTIDTAAHIHCCLTSPFSLVNVGVATTVPAFTGFPLGVTSGSFTSQVFDLTQPLFYNPAFVTLQGGLPQAEASFIAALQNGETYLNIHTTSSPGGEIRGFVVAAPEASSAVLLFSGIAGLFLIRRRKHTGSV